MMWSSAPRLLRVLAIMSLAIASAAPCVANAQAALSGKVLSVADKRALAGAEISIGALKRSTISDSTGAFALSDVTPGRYLISVRKVGYKPFSTMASVLSADGPEYEYALITAQTELPKVSVTADVMKTRFAEFEERRAKRIGRYLTAEDFKKNDGRPVADVILAIPGVDIIRGRGNIAWFASRRGAETIMLERKRSAQDILLNAADGPEVCYATVVLNGDIVFSGGAGEQLFDLNSLNPRDIKGIEIYTGIATTPQQWLTGNGGCGVIAIWLK